MIHTLRRLYKTVRHGTAIESFRYRLKSTGIVIAPYYVIQEGSAFNPPSEFRERIKDYTFEFLGPQDMKIVDEITSWKSSEEHWHSLLEEGKKCFAAKYRGQIVASMWIALDQCDTEWGKFVLKDNEAYLFSLCTKEEYRGRQIASYLRYRSYAALKEMGRDRFYSYSSFFNASSIKFKKRLNARFLKLGLYIELFKKYHWNISMRHYL